MGSIVMERKDIDKIISRIIDIYINKKDIVINNTKVEFVYGTIRNTMKVAINKNGTLYVLPEERKLKETDNIDILVLLLRRLEGNNVLLNILSYVKTGEIIYVPDSEIEIVEEFIKYITNYSR